MQGSDERLGTIGFVGLGDMGGPIAINYARSGLDLLAYDLSTQRMHEVIRSGGRWAKDVDSLIEQADVLCVCLLDDRQVTDFVHEQQIFRRMPLGAILVVHSTITPVLMQGLAEEGATAGIAVVDAPVSGRSHASANQDRVIAMVAAPAATFDKLQPLWAAMSSHAYRVADEPGRAQVVKICNNMMVEVNYLVAL